MIIALNILSGERTTHASLVEAAKEAHTDSSAVSKVLKEDIMYSKGYFFYYENTPKQYKAIQCSNGETYVALKHAAKATKAYPSNILACLKGNLKTTKGLTFKYIFI